MHGCLSRRSLLAGAGTLAAANAFGGSAHATDGLLRPSASAIDVHHHYLPPFYTEKVLSWLKSTNASDSDAIVRWTAQKDTAELDRASVETAILSISSPGFDSPGFDFGSGKETVSLARGCNEFASELSRNSRGRYLFFTALPMPDLDASRKEIAYGYDTLGATGVTRPSRPSSRTSTAGARSCSSIRRTPPAAGGSSPTSPRRARSSRSTRVAP